MVKELKVFVHYIDNGDGSNSAHLYPSRDALVKKLEAEVEKGWSDTTIDLIESGDDPYEHGSVNWATIMIDVNEETGELSLAKRVSLSSD